MRRRMVVLVSGVLGAAVLVAATGPGGTGAVGVASAGSVTTVDLTNLPIGTAVTTTPQVGAVDLVPDHVRGGGASPPATGSTRTAI